MKRSNSELVNVLSIQYMKVVRLFLWPLGAWPGQVFDEKVSLFIRVHRISIPVHIFFLIMAQINHLVQTKNQLNLYHIGHVYMTMGMSILTAVRTTVPGFEYYGVIAKKFIIKFHLTHHKRTGNFEEVNTLVNKISSLFTYFMVSLSVLGIIGFNITPFYNNYKAGVFNYNRQNNVTYEFSIYYKYPGFELEDHFTLCTIYNVYLSFNCAVSTCSLDLFLILMMFQLIGHLYILKSSFHMSINDEEVVLEEKNNANRLIPMLKMFNEEENEKIRIKLKEIVDHHKFIVDFSDDISSFFGPMLGINYLCHLVVCCLLLLGCSQEDPKEMARYGPVTVIVFGQLILISVVFEVVDTVSEKLKDDLYYIPWERMDKRNRTTMYIFLQRLQKPISITAMGMTIVGVKTMAKILKATFSYFTLLRSMNEVEYST